MCLLVDDHSNRKPARHHPAGLAGLWAAKAAVVVLRVLDGGGRTLASAWSPLALAYQDALLASAWLAVDCIVSLAVRKRARAERVASIALWAVVAAMVAYAAFNVAVARVFSTPLTWSMLEATGGALSDSIFSYVTLGNLLAVGLVAAVPLAVARAKIGLPPAVRTQAVLGALFVGMAWLGPVAAARVETLGLHRNALVTLARTSLSRLATRVDDATTGVMLAPVAGKHVPGLRFRRGLTLAMYGSCPVTWRSARAGFGYLCLGVAACGTLTGIDEYAVSSGAAPSCGFTFADARCGACLGRECCAELEACGEDAACSSYQACLAACPSGADRDACRAECTKAATTNASTGRVARCTWTKCDSECELPMVSQTLAQKEPACEACLRTACPDQHAACAADEACLAMLQCHHEQNCIARPDPDCIWTCFDRHRMYLAGESLVNLGYCMLSCSDVCGWGRDFACLRDYEWRFRSGSSTFRVEVVLSVGIFAVLINSGFVPQQRVLACPADSAVRCEDASPVIEATTDENGIAVFELSTQEWRFETEMSEGGTTQRFTQYMGRPVRGDSLVSFRIPDFWQELRTAPSPRFNNTVLQAETGALEVIAYDCASSPVFGPTLEMDPPVQTVTYVTNLSGFFPEWAENTLVTIFYNLAPGLYTVTHMRDGAAVARDSFWVHANTYAQARPFFPLARLER